MLQEGSPFFLTVKNTPPTLLAPQRSHLVQSVWVRTWEGGEGQRIGKGFPSESAPNFFPLTEWETDHLPLYCASCTEIWVWKLSGVYLSDSTNANWPKGKRLCLWHIFWCVICITDLGSTPGQSCLIMKMAKCAGVLLYLLGFHSGLFCGYPKPWILGAPF